jgi:hypothetical protein
LPWRGGTGDAEGHRGERQPEIDKGLVDAQCEGGHGHDGQTIEQTGAVGCRQPCRARQGDRKGGVVFADGAERCRHEDECDRSGHDRQQHGIAAHAGERQMIEGRRQAEDADTEDARKPGQIVDAELEGDEERNLARQHGVVPRRVEVHEPVELDGVDKEVGTVAEQRSRLPRMPDRERPDQPDGRPVRDAVGSCEMRHGGLARQACP